MNVTIGENTIHYLSFGKGETVILLPSFWLTSRSYRKFGIALSKHYRVFIPDLFRGKSQFQCPAKNISVVVETLHEFTQKLHLSCFYLIGVSFSGITAINFVNRYPSLVKKLYLVSTTADPLETESKWRLAWGYPMLIFHNIWSFRGIQADALWITDWFLEFAEHPSQIVWDARMALGKLFPQQTKLPVPTKLLFSRHDEFIPYRFVERMRKIKNLDIEIHDSYHCWFFGREELLAEKIKKYFNVG